MFQVDGPFRWLDGSAWDFTNWDDGEPDRKSVGRTHHECVFVCLFVCLFDPIPCEITFSYNSALLCSGVYSWVKTQRPPENGETQI